MNITVTPAGSQPSAVGPAEYFTGKVRVDAPFKGSDGARIGGYVQQEGQVRQSIRPGDTVWIPPKVKHWHGATPDTGMSHIAIAEALDGNVVEWLEQVTDEDYGQAQ